MMLGIICGRGGYPQLVIKECEKKQVKFCVVFVDESSDIEVSKKVSTISAGFGEVGRVLDFFKRNEVTEVVFAGHVTRPKVSDLIFNGALDRTGAKWLLKLWKVLCRSGDDALLRAVSELFSKNGMTLISGSDFLTGAFLEEGIYSKKIPSKSDAEDIKLGIEKARELGLQDKGQCVVVSNGEVIGHEDERGTDALIDDCYDGILVKLSKPQQDFRMDLPTIGVQTIENLHRHDLKGLVIEAGKTIIIDKEKVIKKIDEYGLFLQVVKLPCEKRVFIIAGEASGDYLGGRLMKDMLKLNPNTEFAGIGGQCMEQAGLITLFPISELSIIGIWEVIGKIFHVKRLIKETVDVIRRYKPDVVITIDSSGFTHRVDKKLKKLGCKFPIVHYVAPPVWAWRKWRAKNMYKFIDKLLVLLPFEVDLFSKHKLNTVFVGHPIAVDNDFTPDEKERESSEELTITLLPGSRPSELEHHMPILKEFVEQISQQYPEVRFYLPTVREVAPLIKQYVSDWNIKPTVSTKKLKKVKAYNSSHVAVAASGTVTLELAKMNLPFVTIYKTSQVTYRLVKWLIHTKYICLVNILAGRRIVPELIQQDCTPEKICEQVDYIIESGAPDMVQQFSKIIGQLTIPRSKAAEEVFESINNYRK